MPGVVVVGAQWGDEGKGKVVDLFAEWADLVVRWGGGNNAGHTLEVAGRKFVLHLVPSGVLYPGKLFLLGEGMVVDPAALLAELDGLIAAGVALDPTSLRLSPRAHLVLPYHVRLDELRERGAGALGTTRRGIGPAYEDKVARRGVRAGDLRHPERLRRRIAAALEAANVRIAAAGGQPLAVEEVIAAALRVAPRLVALLDDTSLLVHHALRAGRAVLFEGAQGALLDIDHGTYPFVTSSNTVAGGAAAALGLGPRAITDVVGVTKAYTTRVGAGPFPSEIHGAAAERIREAGREYGATTGRPRRCGWLDLPALRYAARVSGLSALALTKLDILSGLGPLPVCAAYELDGERISELPPDAEELAAARPALRSEPGFEGDLRGVRRFDDLPAAARAYVEMIERETELPVALVSVGADREQTLIRHDVRPTKAS